jgi:hypothetical protein
VSLVLTLKALAAAGGTVDQLIAVVEAHEASKSDELAQRRAHDAARQKSARERKNNVTSRDSHVTGRESRDPSPRARVSEYITNSENNHLAAAVAKTRDELSDDWPEGGAQRHAELIIAEMASPWLDRDKSPSLVSSAARLASWKRDGASWEHDVLPVIRARLARQRKLINSWGWFDGAIGENIASNRAALAIPEAGEIVPFRQVGPPKSYAEQSSAAWDYAMGKIAEDG